MRQLIYSLIRRNRVYMWVALTLTICLLTIFKLIYPYPNMVLDSYYYVLGAMSHADVSPWAIGYSWFLRIVGVFSHSPLVLVIVQYVLLEVSLMVFFLTLDQVLGIPRFGKWLLMIFFFANPLLLYCANFVMADSLFISLSLMWISLLLWMLYRPSWQAIWIHTILIILVFCVRYNALYYPIVGALALSISRYSLRQKLVGITAEVLVIGGFIGYTSIRVGQVSGQSQFSPFGNWKTANDALYMYGHIYREDSSAVPEKFAALHQMVRQYFEGGAAVDDLLNFRSQFYGSQYMFTSGTPLVSYKVRLYGEDSEFVNFRKMAAVGPLYGQYGAYLIKKFPGAFIEYFVEPNAIRYLFPPMEAFGSLPPFFLRPDYLGQAGRTWFRLHTLTVSWDRINLRAKILNSYQTIVFFVHIVFVLALLGFLMISGLRTLPVVERHSLIVLTALWLLDLGFNLTAAATVMRYEIFPLMIEFALIWWLSAKILLPQTNIVSL
jgi:hypothetical protein